MIDIFLVLFSFKVIWSINVMSTLPCAFQDNLRGTKSVRAPSHSPSHQTSLDCFHELLLQLAEFEGIAPASLHASRQDGHRLTSEYFNWSEKQHEDGAINIYGGLLWPQCHPLVTTTRQYNCWLQLNNLIGQNSQFYCCLIETFYCTCGRAQSAIGL